MLILLLTIFFGYWARHVSFESDLQHMNFMTDKLKRSEKDLNKINEYALRSVYLITEGRTLNEALINNEKLVRSIEELQQKKLVNKFSGVSSLIISDSLQRARIAKWDQYWTPEKKQAVLSTLVKEGESLKFKASAFDKFKELLNKDFHTAGADVMAGIRKNF